MPEAILLEKSVWSAKTVALLLLLFAIPFASVNVRNVSFFFIVHTPLRSLLDFFLNISIPL